MSISANNVVAGESSTDVRRSHQLNDLNILSKLGYTSAKPLSSGMEAAAYTLNDRLVGKIWAVKSLVSLQQLTSFYEELSSSGLSFHTPQIVQIYEIDNRVVSIEQRLPGVQFNEDSRSNDVDGIYALIKVLTELSSIRLSHADYLPVLDEKVLPAQLNSAFIGKLTDLIDRRVSSFGHLLRISIDDFDRKVTALKLLLHQNEISQLGLIHGDLGGGNLLVDKSFNVLSVLDFGFLTTSGDPRFDASITSGIFDMWTSRAQLRQHQFDTILSQELGYEKEVLLIFRAAYAIIIANAYDPTGNDGQFW